MRESTIEKAVCAYAKKLGVFPMKLAGPNQKGQPDRMFLYKGRVLFMELKAPGKKPTPLQRKWLNDLHERQFMTGWADNADDGRDMLDQFRSAVDNES